MKKTLLAASIATALVTPHAVAQTDGPSALKLEEVVVRATRREASTQDLALTVNAYSGDDMRRMGLVSTADVALQTPNVEMNAGIGLNSFNIRGIGSNDFQTNVDAPVSIHVDEVYLSKTFMNKILMFDIERVEIAKGPQGTVNGRNSTGGNVSFYTRQPTDEFEAGLRAEVGNYDTTRLEGFVSGPLSDNLNGRLAFTRVNQREGFYRNVNIGGTEGQEDYTAARGTLAWTFEDTKITVSGHAGSENGSVPPYDVTGVYTLESFLTGNPSGGVGGAIGAAASGALVRCDLYNTGQVTGADRNCVRGHDGLVSGDSDPFTSHSHQFHNVDHDSYGGLVRIDHEIGIGTLSSITAYEYYERDQEEVGDNSPIYTGTWIFWYSEIEQFTQELRLTSGGDGPFNYSAGIFFEHDEMYTRDYLTLGFGPTPGLGGFDTRFDQEVDALAVFAQTDYELTDTVKLTAGLRASSEETSIDGGTCFAAGIDRSSKEDVPTSGCLAQLSSSEWLPDGDSRSDENVSYRFGIQWSPAAPESFDDLMLYATVSSGFRSGGYNADLVTEQSAFVALDPEELVAWEAGFKSMLADSQLRLNGAVFYYDFSDGFINVDNPTSPVPYTINAAGIDVYGLDLTLQWLLTPELRLDAGLGLLDAEIKSDLLSDGRPLDGNRPVNAPEQTYNLSLSWDRPLTDAMTLAANVNYSWRAEQFFETNNKPSDEQESYGLLNAYIGIHTERWELGVWGRNIGDEEYKTYVNDLPVFGWTLANYGPPRTYGATLQVHW